MTTPTFAAVFRVIAQPPIASQTAAIITRGGSRARIQMADRTLSEKTDARPADRLYRLSFGGGDASAEPGTDPRPRA